MLRPCACHGGLRLLRRYLHLYLTRLRLLDLGQREREHAVLVAGLDVVRVHSRGQREAALERAVGPLITVHPLTPLLRDLLLRPVDAQDVVLERDLQVVRANPRDLRRDAEGVRLLEDVHRWNPYGAGVVPVLPVDVAQRVAEEAVDPALEIGHVHGRISKGTSGEKHAHTSVETRT